MNKDNTIEILIQIKGIDRKTALKLYMAGIYSLDDLIACDYNDVSTKIGIKVPEIQKWMDEAKILSKEIPKPDKESTEKESVDSNLSIKKMSAYLGISSSDAKKLRNAGVFGLSDLAQENPKLLSDDSGFPIDKINAWVKKAQSKYRQQSKPSKPTESKSSKSSKTKSYGASKK